MPVPLIQHPAGFIKDHAICKGQFCMENHPTLKVSADMSTYLMEGCDEEWKRI